MTFVLAITSNYHTQNIIFERQEDAKAQLEIVKGRMGYGRGNSDETVTVSSPAGDAVFVASRIDTARLLDESVHNGLVLSNVREQQDRDIDFEVRKHRALSEASQGDAP